MINKILFIIMVFVASIFSACRSRPSDVIFEIKNGFSGAFVIRRVVDSANDWRVSGGILYLDIGSAITEVRSFEPVEGNYLYYRAHLNGVLISLVPMVSAKAHLGPGLFGGDVNHRGEILFFIGSGSEAMAYFDGIKSQPSRRN